MGFLNGSNEDEKKRNKLVAVYPEICPQDHVCPAVAECPTGALTQNGTDAPTVNGVLCIRCGKCVEVCKVGALQMEELMF